LERIGGYGVVRKLGEGGMGTVWLARSRGGRLVAVKVARPELAGDPLFRERFRAEVAAARSVGGFHTAPVVDADPDAAAPWLATAYVSGPTLGELVTRDGPMDARRLRALGAALAEALHAIHRCGLVHRDLKPGNIIMADDGPRVLDFGISRAVENTRLTVTGTAFGTPGYLAPEQAEGREVGPAADVFALGAVLVSAAGGSAFGGGTPVALMYRSVHHAPDLGAVPEPLRPVVAACMDKSPARRPSTEQLLDWFSPADADGGAARADGGAALADGEAVPADATATGGRTAPPPGPVPVDARPDGYREGAESAVARPGDDYRLPPPRPVPAAPPMPGYAPTPHVAPTVAPRELPPSPYAPAGYGHPAPVPAYLPPAQQAAPQLTPSGPEFLAMDRKNAVVADPDGISLGVNGRIMEFPWAAIERAWCERRTGRGHVLVVAVALPDGSVHSCEVGTRRAAELEAWVGQFTALLAYYSRAG
jgi:hypothetical protein